MTLLAELFRLSKSEPDSVDLVAEARASRHRASVLSARSGLLAPSGDLLTPEQQSRLGATLADLGSRGVVLRGYQEATVESALYARRLLLGLAPGLGKTLTSLTSWVADGAPGSLLVVCPPHLTVNWTAEVDSFFPTLSTAIVQGRRPGPLPSADVVVVADSLVDARRHDLVVAARAGVLGALVVDESQRHKSNRREAARADGLLTVAQALDVARPGALILALSGTPVANAPADIYNSLAMLGQSTASTVRSTGPWDPETGAQGYSRFRRFWTTGATYHMDGPQRVTLCRDGHALHDEMRGAGLVWVDRHQVTGLERTLWVPQQIDCSEHLATYRQIEQDFIAWLFDQEGPEAAMRASMAMCLTRIGHLRKAAALAKVPATVDLVRDLVQQDEHVVVFTHHRTVAESVLCAFEDAGLRPARLVGGMSAQAKREEQQRYQRGDSDGIVVANLQAAAVGINLDSPRSRTVCFLQLPQTPADIVQASGRVERLTQQRSCVALVPLATDAGRPTVEHRMWSAVRLKSDVADQVVTRSTSRSIDLVVDGSAVPGSLLVDAIASYARS